MNNKDMKNVLSLALATAGTIIFTGAAVGSGKELIKIITNIIK